MEYLKGSPSISTNLALDAKSSSSTISFIQRHPLSVPLLSYTFDILTVIITIFSCPIAILDFLSYIQYASEIEMGN